MSVQFINSQLCLPYIIQITICVVTKLLLIVTGQARRRAGAKNADHKRGRAKQKHLPGWIKGAKLHFIFI